jgi:hypothetical protein
MQGVRACASGYNDAQKRHLAYLMHLLGGALTDTMRRTTTHLLVPCRAGAKFAKTAE